MLSVMSAYVVPLGIWLDTIYWDNVVRNSFYLDNSIAGIGLENSVGPNYLYNNIIMDSHPKAGAFDRGNAKLN